MKLFSILIAIVYFDSCKAGLIDSLIPLNINTLNAEIIPKLLEIGVTLPLNLDITNVKAFKCFDVTKSFDGKEWNPLTTPCDQIFDRYMKVFNKTYTAKELPQRRANIVKSIVDIVKCIIDSFLGKIVIQHTLGLNPLSDLNESEFKALLGTKPGAPRNQTIDVSETVSVRRKRSDIFDAVCQPKSSSPLPASFDWRTSYSKNFVTSVKDQKQCGDCWAFATSATIESQYLIKTGQSANTTDCDLSEQDLLNCASSDGCNGETIDAAMNEVINNGQAREAAAPYLGMVDPNGCHHYPIVNGLIISDYCSKGGVWTTTYSNGTVVQWTEDNPDSKIIRDLIDWGPIVFLLNADQIQGYKSGIFSSNNCSTDINHAVTLVGYGTSSGIDYWIIKNSWGPLWGEGGYFRMRRGNLNMCGSNYQYYYPIMTSTAPYNHS